MAAPKSLDGRRWRLYRQVTASPATWDWLCIVATLGLTRTNELEDVTMADCDNPLAASVRTSTLKSTSWSSSIGGVIAADHWDTILAMFRAGTPTPLAFVIDENSGAGGIAYTGNVWFENLEMTSQDRGAVRFTATLRGDGDLTDVTVASILNNLAP